MKIGIISDTHDHHANVLKAVEIFKNENVNARFIAIFGNNDGEKFMLKNIIEGFGGEIHRDPYHGQIAGKKIFMTHKPGTLDEVIASGKYDIIVYGHTHFRDIRTVGKTLIINPG
jgi:putative phosphoesterase